jgi:dihydrodipicolinate synthase/N-acetylneuraminate lyase
MGNVNLFRGACTELITPYDANGAINYKFLVNEIDDQLEAGISALFVNGLAGEALLTTKQEQVDMTKTTVKRVNGKVPVISNIVSNIPANALELLNEFEKAGVDAICITQPMSYEYTSDAIYKFFSDLATAAKLPVYIYNAPQSGNIMSPNIIAKLVNEHENIIGYKDSTQDIVHLQTVMKLIKKEKHFECVSGSDATIFPTLAVGGTGVISLISAVFPNPVINVCDAYFQGEIEKSFACQKYVLDIRTVLKVAPMVAGYKYASELIGKPLGEVRAPLANATDAQKKSIKENLTKLGLI